jgi:omega-6 fatty acid desaturase (delta-12 desaturase)
MTAMSPAASGRADESVDLPALNRALGAYRESSLPRSLFELAVTLIPLAALWAGMAASFAAGQYWLTALLALPTAAFLVRGFMIQHDCGHGAFFASKAANDWTGRVLSLLTLTPYDYWKRTHAEHHASSGNLDRRGMGDIDTLTVAEYRGLSAWGRLRYRAYRHPLVMFGIGPAYLFLVQHRVPMGLMRGAGLAPWASAMGTTLGAALLVGFAGAALGWAIVLLVWLPVVLLAASIGVWLFYVQHQFEETVWDNEGDWRAKEAAFHGSSHYDLPQPLRWFTANIGMHHVHHLASRIPYYRLPQVLEDFPALKETGRLTIMESVRCVRLTLWDEETRRLVRFADAPA